MIFRDFYREREREKERDVSNITLYQIIKSITYPIF